MGCIAKSVVVCGPKRQRNEPVQRPGVDEEVIENKSGPVGDSGRIRLSPKVAFRVNINYSFNMAISKIRKYLDNLGIRADGPLGRDIPVTNIPKTLETAAILQAELEWKNRREGLNAKRHGLFEQFELTPNNVRLGQEIKTLDDQIADCTEHMKLKK
ncbi:MAG TPA: hypothetical protein VGH37_12425 [Candidatus Acidoferrum sp.]|jgi:hypothetical protein